MLIMRDPHHIRMFFKSVKTLGALNSQMWKRPRLSASAFTTAKNVELRGLYPIRLLVSLTHEGSQRLCIVKMTGVEDLRMISTALS